MARLPNVAWSKYDEKAGAWPLVPRTGEIMEVPYVGKKSRGRLAAKITKRYEENKHGIFLTVRSVGQSFSSALEGGFHENEGVIHLCCGKPEGCKAKLKGVAGALHVGGFRILRDDMFDNCGYKISTGVRHSKKRARSPSLSPATASETEDALKRKSALKSTALAGDQEEGRRLVCSRR